MIEKNIEQREGKKFRFLIMFLEGVYIVHGQGFPLFIYTRPLSIQWAYNSGIHEESEGLLDEQECATNGINSRVLKLCFFICSGYPWNMGIGISKLTNEPKIILPVETWEHETQRNQGLDNYHLHFLIWPKNPKQQRHQGG